MRRKKTASARDVIEPNSDRRWHVRGDPLSTRGLQQRGIGKSRANRKAAAKPAFKLTRQ